MNNTNILSNKVLFTLTIFGLILLSAIYYPNIKSMLNNQKVETLIVADANFQSNALLYLAYDKGYFQEEGLNVERKVFTISTDALQDVIDGKSDIAAVGDIPFLIQYKNGQDIKIISSLQRSQNSIGIIAWKKKGINKLENLVGKKVGVVKGTASEFLLLSLLSQHNIPKERIDISYGGVNELDELFRMKKLDAIAIGNPNRFQILEDNDPNDISEFYSNSNIDSNVLVTKNDSIQDKNNALKKFLRALAKAENYAANSDNIEDSVNSVARIMKSNSTSTIEILWNNYNLTLNIDYLLLEILTNHSNALTNLENLPNTKGDIKDAVSSQILNKVKNEDVTIIDSYENKP